MLRPTCYTHKPCHLRQNPGRRAAPIISTIRGASGRAGRGHTSISKPIQQQDPRGHPAPGARVLRQRRDLFQRGRGRGARGHGEPHPVGCPGVLPGHRATAPRDLSVPGSRPGALCDPLRGPVPGRHGRRAPGPREGPVQLLPGRAPGVLRDPQGRAAAPPAPVTRCLGHRAAQGPEPRDARHHRGGRARCGVLDARACPGQVQPARELDRRRGLGLHPRRTTYPTTSSTSAAS